jgi:hypothetical protein
MPDSPTPPPRQFDTTQWSLVNAAGAEDPNNSQTQEALEQLCQRYWFPLYAFLRSHTHPTWITLTVLAWLLPTLHTALHPRQDLHDRLAKTFITHR